MVILPAGPADAQTAPTANHHGSYTVPADWPLIPAGLNPGDEFRLLFMTNTHFDASSTSISTYDTHVQNAITNNGHADIRAYVSLFRVVGSTGAVDARDHTRMNPGNRAHVDAPVYWLNGPRVASGKSTFWSDTWENWALTDRRVETGARETGSDWPWTGTMTDGRKDSSHHLGASSVRRGIFRADGSSMGPIASTFTSTNTESHSVYGISPRFRVAGAESFVQFRTCEGTVSPSFSSALVSNLGQTSRSSGQSLNTLGAEHAQSFTTGATAYTLTSVAIGFDVINDAATLNGSPGLEVTIRSVSGTDPGAVLGALRRPTLANSSTAQTYTFTHSGLQLQPNTMYWLVVKYPGLNVGNNYISSTNLNNEDGGAASGWSIGNAPLTRNAVSNTWGTNNQGHMQFRVNGWATGTGDTCSTGWVETAEGDPPPTITIQEGGSQVTYQWRVQDDLDRGFWLIRDQVTKTPQTYGGYMGVGGYSSNGGPDRDRLICHTGTTGGVAWVIGEPVTDEGRQQDTSTAGTDKAGGHAGVGFDRHNGCPFAVQSIYWHERTEWRSVTIAAGEDSDAFDHATHLIHAPKVHGNNGQPAEMPDPQPVWVPLKIVDEDAWENDIVFSDDGGSTWTALEDGGLAVAFPASLNPGVAAHSFQVRLRTDPSTLPAAAGSTKRFFMSASTASPITGRTLAERQAQMVTFSTNAGTGLSTIRNGLSGTGSVTVSYTPITVEINVGADPPTAGTLVGNLGQTAGSSTGLVSTQRRAQAFTTGPNAAGYTLTSVDLRFAAITEAAALGQNLVVTIRSSSGINPGTAVGTLVNPAFQNSGSAQTYRFTHAGLNLSPRTVYWVVLESPSISQSNRLSRSSPTAEDAGGADGWSIADSSFIHTGSLWANDGATILHMGINGKATVVGVTGTVIFTGEAFNLYGRVDNEISTATPKVPVRTDTFSWRWTNTSCVGCLRVMSLDLPDPVDDHVGDLTATNLSDTGIDLSWPDVIGAEGYSVRYWSTISPFADNPNVPEHRPEDVWFSYEPRESSVSIQSLAPNTEYRVQVFYYDHGVVQLGSGSPTLRFTTLASGATPQPQPTTPVLERDPEISVSPVNITVDEGEAADFTVSASPPPDAPLEVRVEIDLTGDTPVVAADQLGRRTVTVPVTGSVTISIPTSDDGGHRSNGSLTATVIDGDGYRASPFGDYASVWIRNDDAPPPPSVQLKRVSDTTATIAWEPQEGVARYTLAWFETVSRPDALPQTQWAAVEATEHQLTGLDPETRYAFIVFAGTAKVGDIRLTTLAAGESQTFEVSFATSTPQTPEISVSGGGDITEGGDATFTVSASPAPSADLDVKVTVTQSGDYGATTGQRTVTVPTSGSVTFTVGTTDDDADEADGSVTATLVDGAAYDLGASKTATVTVSDNDAPTPVVSVSGGSGITEGGDASFTVSASPAPSANLDVKVTVTQSGDYGATTGQRTVTIPTTGSVTFSVGTTDDQTDEANGSVTATVNAGSGYTVSASQGAATVGVSDNDDPKPQVSITSSVGGSEGESVSFTISANPAPTTALPVSVTVATAGDFGFGSAPTSVTIPTGGSLTLTIATTDDKLDEPDGSVTLTLNAGSDYTLGTTSSESVEVTDDDGSTPEISISGGSGITEGGDASFTVTANPAPSANLDVKVTVTQSGDYGATTGQRTVTIPTSGSVTFTIGTTDDQADESDGSVTATLVGGADYDLGPTKTATVTVSDNDDGPDYTDYQTVVDYLIQVRDNPENTAVQGNPAHILKWNRVLAAIGYDSGESPMAESEIHANAARWPDSPFKPPSVYLKSLEGQPVVSVSSGSGITEGGSASFTVSASPAPSANLDVKVTVTQSGDYGATTGQRTVTVPTSGSVTFTVGTTDDDADEADGSVTATLVDGAAYDLGASKTATVTVSDNDDPTPVVSIAGGSGITEGGSASFTVSASPAPSANLDVKVTVTQSGDYGATTGQRTVTIPTSGSVTFTVGTTDDSADETDGSVTATLVDGAAYDLGTSKTATVTVSDNDDPTPVVSIAGGSGVTEGGSASFTVSASPAPSANLDVKVTVTQSGDYGATTGQRTVTIPTSGSVSFTVGTTDDSADETDGSVTATVDADSGYTVSSSQGAATVNVADNDDAPRISVTVEDASATEGGVLTFRVRLSAASTEEVRIRWYTAPAYDRVDDRAHRSDYQASEGELVFAAGVTELTAEVLLEQDDEDEPDEYFAVEAFLPGSFFTPDAVGTMTIVDDD